MRVGEARIPGPGLDDPEIDDHDDGSDDDALGIGFLSQDEEDVWDGADLPPDDIQSDWEPSEGEFDGNPAGAHQLVLDDLGLMSGDEAQDGELHQMRDNSSSPPRADPDAWPDHPAGPAGS